MFFSLHRSLVQALAVSLLIHAALLLSIVNLLPVRFNTSATTITVVMSRESKSDAVKQVNTSIAKVFPESVKPDSRVVRKTAEQKLVVQDRLSAFPITPSISSFAREVVSSASVSASAAMAGGVGSVNAPVPEGVNANDLHQYRMLLGKAAKRFERYPALARERGWEGRVEIALNVDTLLPVPEVVLVHSSGHGLLDKQALEMVAQAVRVTTLPERLKGKDFRVFLPVIFSLNDD